jgi:pseudouridine-5'-phosphate glycosidase
MMLLLFYGDYCDGLFHSPQKILLNTCIIYLFIRSATTRMIVTARHLLQRQVRKAITTSRIDNIEIRRLWDIHNIRSISSTTVTCTSSSSDGDVDNNGGIFQIQDRVKDALAKGNPVCALESTIVAHGMPFPENLKLAQEVERILEEKDVVPAHIAIRDGVCRVGLSEEELYDLARSGEEGRAQKCSTRDLPMMIATAMAAATATASQTAGENKAKTIWGATTVAATMKLAHLAGIATFVTGGIGGVHRNGQYSMDISSDLTELGQTPVVVVSAGIKSILDIQRTIEVLETNGVPAIGWQTDEFPAFFSPSSGIPCPSRADTAEVIADAYWAARKLNMVQGMLVAVPNNDPAGAYVETAIQAALAEAEELNISGRDVTPYVLKQTAAKTEGDSLRSNMALVRQNAKIGADIAIAISRARRASYD